MSVDFKPTLTHSLTHSLTLFFFFSQPPSSFLLHIEVYMSATLITVSLAVVLMGWAYRSIRPPQSKICGSVGGPLVTSPRVKLSDGRHLAYKETGVPKEKAKYKIILVHGMYGSRNGHSSFTQELADELKLYIVSYDRAGYGESDPNPSRSVKSEAFDVQELADELEIGSRFYILGFSMGGYTVWSCLKYIPHRLAGASLVAPFVNYWWPGFPAMVLNNAFGKMVMLDRLSFRVAHYTPSLFHLWLKAIRTWFPSSARLFRARENTSESTQQGEYESLWRDVMVDLGKWEFSPLELDNPFPEKKGAVQLWQGYLDDTSPYEINCHIADKLGWIKFHGLPDEGHLFIVERKFYEGIVRELVLT